MKQDARRKAMKEKAKGKRAEQKKETETEAMMLKLLSSLKQSLAVGKPKRRTRCITLKRHKNFVEAIKKIRTYAKYGDAVRKEAEDLVNKLSCGIQTPASKVSQHKQQKKQHKTKRMLGNVSSAKETSGRDCESESLSDSSDSDDGQLGRSKSRNETCDSHGEIMQGLERESTNLSCGKQVSSQKKTAHLTGASKARAKKGGKEKVHYCTFCNRGYTNMYEHLFAEHSDEAEVRSIMALPRLSLERRRCIGKLTNLGDYKHNSRVLGGSAQGPLVVKQRARRGTTGTVNMNSYSFCSVCKGLYKKRALFRHEVKCGMVAKKRKDLMPEKGSVSRKLGAVFAGMQSDRLTLIARTDPLILKLGEYYVNSEGEADIDENSVAQKMTEASRLLSQACSLDPSIKTARDLINPENFDVVISAIYECCSFNEASGTFGAPSLAIKMGHYLTRIADILDAEGLKAGIVNKHAEGFRRLMTLEWGPRTTPPRMMRKKSEDHERKTNTPIPQIQKSYPEKQHH
ncbi:uncharacterized protein [Diadema antillarum]|uniref:uncharacterized protein n=1 Tax=Diadema antillarum TaxID=105358 RepID=UPI003A8437C4